MKRIYNEIETRKDRFFMVNYNGRNYRFIKIKSCKIPGFEEIKKNKNEFIDVNSEEVKRISLSRTKRNIRELALCNNFKYFATITVNSEKADRYNLDIVQEKLKKILKKIKRKNSDFAYLFITEKHKDGAFHFHGLVKGIDDLYINEYGYYCSHLFTNELGYNSFSEIKSYEKCCSYITKYITKDCIKNSHNQIYISSKGLKKADKIEVEAFDFIPTFKNDFVSIMDIDITKISRQDLLKYCQLKQIG